MKKVRIFLASTACVVAAGVYANKAKTALNTYFVPSYVNRGQISGVFCSIVVTLPCISSSGSRCTTAFVYPEETTVTYHPIVSKTALGGDPGSIVCTAVFKP